MTFLFHFPAYCICVSYFTRDMITTGRSAVDRDLVTMLVDELRRLLDGMKGGRLTVGQIRQALLRNMGGGGTTPQRAGGSGEITVSMAEVEEAVRELEAEGMLKFIESTQTAIIRS